MSQRSDTPSWRVDDRRDMAEDEYSEPGIAIGAELPEVGFVSVASVVYGCEEAKALGDQMDIAQRIVAALNGIHAGYINDLKNEIADLKARLSASSETLPKDATNVERLWLAVRVRAEGSDWNRDGGEALYEWADRKLAPSSATNALGWIDDDQRKPELWQEVLIYHVLGDRDSPQTPHGFDVAWWTDKGWLFPWDRGDRQRPMFVTHWMALPEAP